MSEKSTVWLLLFRNLEKLLIPKHMATTSSMPVETTRARLNPLAVHVIGFIFTDSTLLSTVADASVFSEDGRSVVASASKVFFVVITLLLLPCQNSTQNRMSRSKSTCPAESTASTHCQLHCYQRYSSVDCSWHICWYIWPAFGGPKSARKLIIYLLTCRWW